MAALQFDNLLFLLLVAVAMLFRWLASVASKASKDVDETDERSTSIPRADQSMQREPADSEAERIRKFLEALGQPTSSKPPPPVAPRQPTYQKPVVLPHVVPPFGSPLPPLTTRPPELPKRITLPRQVTSPPPEKKPFKPAPAQAPVFEVQESAAVVPPPPPVIATPAVAYRAATEPTQVPDRNDANIMALLKSPAGLRNAIILREVFGPPRSLQPLELV